jgi:hypothetical protein
MIANDFLDFDSPALQAKPAALNCFFNLYKSIINHITVKILDYKFLSWIVIFLLHKSNAAKNDLKKLLKLSNRKRKKRGIAAFCANLNLSPKKPTSPPAPAPPRAAWRAL